MTSNYIKRQAVATFDSNGNATAKLGPAVGQFWAPAFVSVAVETFTVITGGGLQQVSLTQSHAVIFIGTANQIAPGAYIDDTNSGNGDVSSVIGGTLLEAGDFVYAIWDSGHPGDLAVFTLYTVTDDVPPSMGMQIPPTGGIRFAGHPLPITQQPPGDASSFSFANPGFSNIVTLLTAPNAASQFLLYDMAWGWTVAFGPTVAGFFQASVNNLHIIADFATDTSHRHINFGFYALGGLTIGAGSNFQFFQGGSGTANNSTMFGSVVYSTVV